jgi:Ribonucleotide reductase, alpha subunit
MSDENAELRIEKLPEETLAWFGGDELRARIFIDKYAMKDREGNLIEKLPEEMWERVANEISSVEPENIRGEWRKNFYWLLEDFKMVPGGRILFGAGQEKYGRRATLNNCYVIPVKDDSLEAIFEWTKEAARTYSLGGGVGTDISILRPKGAPVNNAALKSTGSVSFMNIMSETTAQ